MWGFMGGRGGMPTKFEEQLHCYSAAMADKAHLEVSRFYQFEVILILPLSINCHIVCYVMLISLPYSNLNNIFILT